MIPRIIHYCWYGKGKLSDEIRMCINSWTRFCPDYKIKRWDETNTPMDISWIKEAYKHQKYAFVADYIRFYALYHEGGIYMDTDMLLVKPLDAFFKYSFFAGLQDKYSVAFGIVGSEKEFGFNKYCLDYYDSIKFDMVRPPIITHVITKLLKEKGFVEKDEKQVLDKNIVLYPSEYFYPIHYSQDFELSEIEKYCNANTVGVHLWNKSWTSELGLLEDKKYKEGFYFAFERLKRTPILPLSYYKKLVKYVFLFLFRIKK